MLDEYVCIGFLAPLAAPLLLALAIATMRKPGIREKRVGLWNSVLFALIPLVGGPPLLMKMKAAYNAAVTAAMMTAPGPGDSIALGWSCFYAAIVIASPAIGLLSAGTYVAIHNNRRAEKLRSGRCFACGYDLTGNTSGRCPECGEEIHHESSCYPW